MLSLLLLLIALPAAAQRFVIVGDRTGEAQAGVYEQVWREAAAQRPEFIVSVGDTIQGSNDATAESQWRDIRRILAPYRHIPLFLASGNHDVWSARSEALFVRYAGHPLHYSFDRGNAHFTVLDNSRVEGLPEAELQFLERDLAQHSAAKVKFVIMHRPSWLIDVLFGNPHSGLHRIARKYGVQYIIAGHVHEMLHAELDGVHYVSMPSSGGHLRGSRKYEDGWLFGYALFDRDISVRELKPPYGKGRTTSLSDWGKTGLKTPR